MENENKVIPTEETPEIPENKPAPEEVITEAVASEAEPQEKRCPNCQALLDAEQAFCPECGASLKKVCANCGAELQDGQAFCPSCGQKTEGSNVGVNADIAQFNAGIEKQKSKKKMLPIIVGILAVCAVAIYLLSAVFLNPQHYIEKGDYQTAYKVAGEGAKENVLRENIIATVSADCMDSLKDPESFELRDAWIRFNESSKIIILKVAANNTYGNKIINYWYYSYDKDDKEYSLYTTFSDFDEEKVYSWDDSSEKIEKLLKNLAKKTASDIISDGVQIEESSIDTINLLFENDMLENVKLINAEPQKTE